MREQTRRTAALSHVGRAIQGVGDIISLGPQSPLCEVAFVQKRCEDAKEKDTDEGDVFCDPLPDES